MRPPSGVANVVVRGAAVSIALAAGTHSGQRGEDRTSSAPAAEPKLQPLDVLLHAAEALVHRILELAEDR
jgi:hypothetical protein